MKLADHEVSDPAELRILTAGLDVGAQVPLVFYRDGAAQTVNVTIAELPDAPEAAFLGFHVREVPAGEGKTVIEVDQVYPAGARVPGGLAAGNEDPRGGSVSRRDRWPNSRRPFAESIPSVVFPSLSACPKAAGRSSWLSAAPPAPGARDENGNGDGNGNGQVKGDDRP